MKNYYIYRFLDKNNNPIYIGRTEHMDNRFFYEEYAHFSQGSHLPDECYKEIENIEFTEVNSESEQIIYEAALINKLRPKYNKQFVDTGQIQIEFPDFKWLIWPPFTDEVKRYLEKRSGKAQPIQDFFSSFLDEYSNLENPNDYINTGYPELDCKLMIKNSNLILLSGDTGMGKTAFALNICRNLMKRNRKILYINLKDDNETIFLKLLSQECLISYSLLASHELTAEDWKIFSENIEFLYKSNLFLSGETMIDDIIIDIENGNFDFVIIDDFYMIENRNDFYNRDKAFDILKKLKIVSMKKKVPIIILQSNSMQKSVKRSDHRPMLTDFEYNSFVNFCDTIIFLYRDEVYYPDTEEKNIIEVLIGKNKYGTGAVKLSFYPNHMCVANFATE